MLPERAAALQELRRDPLDVLILGGGINGAGVARDLALRASVARRPMRVGLVEQRHFASGTSGRNSQLIHGGLRYLKYFEFNLVREALRERATLLDLAPHLVEPLPFLIPMYSHFARLFYGTGLWLYDMLAGSKRIGSHRSVSVRQVNGLEPGLSMEGLTGGALFYDCRVHSARFVLENIADAAAHGAVAVNYVKAGSMTAEGDCRYIELLDAMSGDRFGLRARRIVDTRGPWAEANDLRLVRGSHIILPRLNASDNAIAYFDENGRIVFLIPWGERRDLTLVGTTDVDHAGGPDEVRISNDELRYLLGIVERLFPTAERRVISTYSSLRPLVKDERESATSASREHRIWKDAAGTVNVTGGKYTTYRAMAEEACDLICEDIAPELRSVHETMGRRLPGALAGAVGELKEYGALADEVRKHQPESSSGALTPLGAARIRYACVHEMAIRLADVMFISTYWGYERKWSATTLRPYAAEMGRFHGWDEIRMEQEVELVLWVLR